MTKKYLNKHFYPKFHTLDKEAILRMNKSYNDPTINNVVAGINEECYGLGMMSDDDSIQYHVYYLNGKDELSGCLLNLDINDPERDYLLIVFAMHIADTYDLDVLYAFNTFQHSTRSMCEQVGYYTMTTDELLPYKDKNPIIAVKNVKGVFVIPLLYHKDLYKFIFGDIPVLMATPGDSFVYLMHNSRNNLVKIGKSRNPIHREKTLQAEEPEIIMIAVWKAEDKLERHLHRLYKHKRLRGEWFQLTFKEMKEIKNHVDTFITQESNLAK